jgi:hypothetical protein
LGDAAGQIVDSLFSGSVKLSELPTKTRLATIMLASRFSKRILDYVNLQEDPELDREFQNFQQGLVNLRQSVENLNPKQSAAVVSKLARTIAQTESQSEKEVARSVSSKTTSPVPTRKRRASDIANAIDNLTFAETPASTFKHFSSLLSETKILEEVAKSDQPLVILLTPDHTLEELLKRLLTITSEEFATLPTVGKVLRLMVLKKASLSAGKAEGIDGSKYIITKLSGKFRIAETGKPGDGLIAMEDGSQYSDVTFYEVNNFFLGNFVNQIVSEVKKLLASKKSAKEEPVVTHKKTVPPPKRTPVVAKSEAPILHKKTQPAPKVEETEEEPVVTKKKTVPPPKRTPVVAKSEETEEEPVVTKKKTQPAPKRNPNVAAKRKESACERVFAEYKNKKISKIGTLLLGVEGVFGDLYDQEVDLLRGDVPTSMVVIDATEKFTYPMDAEMVNFLIDLKEALEKGRESNPLFNPSINFNDLSGTCKALTDLISGKTAPVKKTQASKSSAPSKKQSEPESEESEESELPNLLVLAGFDQFVALVETTGEPILTQKPLIIFAPTDDAIANFLDSYEMDAESFLARQDLVDAIISAHYIGGLEISDEYMMADGETVQHVEDDPVIDEPDYIVYSTDEVRVDTAAKLLLGEEIEQAPTKSTKEVIPEPISEPEQESRSPCEQIIQMADLFGRNPSMMDDFFSDPEISPLPLEDMTADTFGDAYVAKLGAVLGEGSDASNFLTPLALRYLFQSTQGYVAGIGSETAVDFRELPFDCDGWGKLEIAGAQHKVTGGVAKVARSVVPTEIPQESATGEPAIIQEAPYSEVEVSLKDVSDSMRLLGETDILNEIDWSQPHTFFLPTNDAWQKMYTAASVKDADELLAKLPKAVKEVLQLHIHDGRWDVQPGSLKVQYQGKQVPVSATTFITGKILGEYVSGQNLFVSIDQVQDVRNIAKATKKSSSATVASIRMKGKSASSKSPEIPRMVAEVVGTGDEEEEPIEL